MNDRDKDNHTRTLGTNTALDLVTSRRRDLLDRGRRYEGNLKPSSEPIFPESRE